MSAPSTVLGRRELALPAPGPRSSVTRRAGAGQGTNRYRPADIIPKLHLIEAARCVHNVAAILLARQAEHHQRHTQRCGAGRVGGVRSVRLGVGLGRLAVEPSLRATSVVERQTGRRSA